MQLHGFRAIQVRLAVLLLSSLLVAGEGCRTPQRTVVNLNSSGVPHYDQLRLVYVVDGSHRMFPLHPAEVSQVSLEETPVESSAKKAHAWERASLVLQYPHPSGDTSMARATLHLTHRAKSRKKTTSNPFGSGVLLQELNSLQRLVANPELSAPEDEIRVLDVSRAQLDDMLVNLSSNGFFDAQERSDSGTAVDLHLDQSHVRKTWVAEPPLERLLTRVYREGKSSQRQQTTAILTKGYTQK